MLFALRKIDLSQSSVLAAGRCCLCAGV